MPAPTTQTKHVRKIGSIPFVSGSRQTLDLDRDGVLLGLNLRLRFTVTNGGNGPTTPKFQTLARLLKRIEILAGGRDTVVNITGHDLAARVQYESAAVARGMDATVVLTNSAVTAYDVSLPLSFMLPRGRRPDDTGLDTRGLSSLSLITTWGTTDAADLFGTTNSAAISSVTLDVEGHYLLNPPETPFLVRALDYVQQEVTASSSNFALIMDRGTGLAYRTMMLVADANDVGNDSIINSLRLEEGSFVYQNTDFASLKGSNKVEYNQSSLITGMAMLNLIHLGEAITAINTGGLTSDLKLVLDVTKQSGTNYVRVQREAIRGLKL